MGYPFSNGNPYAVVICHFMIIYLYIYIRYIYIYSILYAV